MIVGTSLRYLALFTLILAALACGAYLFVAREYQALLAPALGTPEAAAAYNGAMQNVAFTLLLLCIPVLAVFAVISWFLARASLRPLLDAQERERLFAADAAHALRSPLATIAAIAQQHCGDDECDWATIERAALDASATVGDLLTLARGAGPNALVLEPADIAAIVADTVTEFSAAAARKQVALVCDARSAIANADERRIRELTRNLIDNALRYARSRIDVRVTAEDGDVRICVANDGDRVAPADRAKLFERFYRAGSDSAGSGLGLAIVNWIAHAHGGSAAYDDSDAGATFVVDLPAL